MDNVRTHPIWEKEGTGSSGGEPPMTSNLESRVTTIEERLGHIPTWRGTLLLAAGIIASTVSVMVWFDQKWDDRFERMDKRFEKVDARFEKVDARFDKVDAKFDKMDTKFEKINDRLLEIDKKLATIKPE